jgi:hypothetical protein
VDEAPPHPHFRRAGSLAPHEGCSGRLGGAVNAVRADVIRAGSAAEDEGTGGGGDGDCAGGLRCCCVAQQGWIVRWSGRDDGEEHVDVCVEGDERCLGFAAQKV